MSLQHSKDHDDEPPLSPIDSFHSVPPTPPSPPNTERRHSEENQTLERDEDRQTSNGFCQEGCSFTEAELQIVEEGENDDHQAYSNLVLPPQKLNTLRQIQQLELLDADTEEEEENDEFEEIWNQASSVGSARVAGEDDLWSYSGEDVASRSWVSRA